MASSDLKSLLELVDEAIQIDPVDRISFIRSRTGGDRQLADQVERMLASEDELGAFLDEPAAEVDSVLDLVKEPTEDTLPDKIGPYAVIRRIGRGGMGNVYLAEQSFERVGRFVAVKVIRRGMDSESVVARFRMERNILAGLNHPNIARLLDAGTTDDGRAYFVMEYVDGQPITEYCDTNRLTIDERLALFETVCRASHYAHQNLIVHRDIKPSNILVDEDGNVKLLDFGVAKLLDAADLAYTVPVTTTQEMYLTPDYASPEQLRGEAISTSSDVYALGVLLYELLSGARPFRSSATSRIDFINRVCIDTPTRPSVVVAARDSGVLTETVARHRSTTPRQLGASIAGELDTIVLKSIRKEPHERYLSVEQLREDVARYRRGEPIIARRATMRYRLRKAYQRNRVAMLAAACALIAIVALTGLYVTHLAKQRTAAEYAALRAESVRDFVVGLFEQSTFASGRPTEEKVKAALTLIEPALDDVDKLDSDPVARIAVLNVIGNVLQSNESSERSIEVLREADQLGAVSDVPILSRAETWHFLGRSFFHAGQRDSAIVYSTRARRIREAELGPLHAETLESFKYEVWSESVLTGTNGRIEEAVARFEAAFGPNSEKLAGVLNDLGQGRGDLSISYFERAIDIYDRAGDGKNPLGAVTKANLALAIEQQDSLRSLTLATEATNTLQEVLGVEHPLSLSTLRNVGAMHAERRQHESADSILTLVEERYFALNPDHTAPRTVLLFWHGMAKLGLGEYAEAASRLATVLDVLPVTHRRYDDTAGMYTRALIGLGENAKAREFLSGVINQLAEEQIETPPDLAGLAAMLSDQFGRID